MTTQVETGWDVERSVVGRFADQVTRWPDRVAIRTHDRVLTYREVDQLANRIAHSIPRSADRTPVAVLCLDEIEFQVAQLGVLKSGRPALPIHPTEPEARRTLILDESGADALIVTGGGGSSKPDDRRVVIKMDELAEEDGFLGVEILPDHHALIQFTSGSTGTPKGVVHSHRSVLAKTMAYAQALQISSGDRLMLVSRMTSLDTYGGFLTGAGLYPYDIRNRGIVDLPDWMREQRISVFRSPPSVFRSLAAHLGHTPFPDLRIVVQAGEVLSPSDLDLFRSNFGSHTRLLHLYGSAETGVATTQFIGKDFDALTSTLPVGKAVPGLEVLIVDRDEQPVADGEVGIIAISGPSLAVGYLGRDGLTSERFKGIGTARRFISGDMGRFDGLGRLEIIGRDDTQVKVRGQRVEIGEVETALRRVTGLAEVVVTARSNAVGATRLVGYYTLRGEERPAIGTIRKEASRELPDYMLPTVWVHMSSFPMNAIGKIDRQALPEPPQGSSRDAEPGVDAVARLAALWSDLLDVDEVEMSDSFFDLGGDSLAAAGLLAAVEQEFGCRIPMADLFEQETLEFMAALVEVAEPGGVHRLLAPLTSTGELPPLYCLDMPGWSGIRYLHLARNVSSEQPLVAVVDDLADAGLPYSSVEEIAEVYAQAILEASDGPYHLVGQSAAGVVAYEVGRQIALRGEEVGFVGMIDTNYPGIGEPRNMRRLSSAVRRHGLLGTAKLAVSRLRWWLRHVGKSDLAAASADDSDRPERMSSAIDALSSYRVEPFHAAVTLFRAVDGGDRSDAVTRWQGLGADVVDVPGTHSGPDSVLGEPLAEDFAQTLESAIARVAAR